MGMQDTASISKLGGQISAVFFGTIAVWWGGVALLLQDWTFNITTEFGDGQRVPMVLVWFIKVVGSAPFMVVTLATICIVSRRLTRYRLNYRLWLLCLLFAGTPISVASGRFMATYLWRAHHVGIDWENMLPPTLGLVASLALTCSVQSLTTLSCNLRRYAAKS